ncbi:hypothetical protein [Methylibium sp.]|uniref:hypothetical protein n=1 Tax=Methylibium sp. TaxID=2067992 RepID=UPI0018317E62|nr:hypothetical protein [Methylibium sp.]MBA3589674.1 hypothetical protein [Methylibium sp.]
MTDVDVELQGGIKIKLPEEQATAYTAARAKDKAERETLAQVAGAAKAEKDAAAAAAAKAESEKQAMELTKKGEFDKARELLTAEHTKRIDSFAGKYRDTHLRAQVAGLPALLKLPDAKAQTALVDDVVAQLRGSCRFDLDSDTLQVIGQDGRPALASDGKPMQADAFIAQFLEARPYLRQPTKTPGSGGAGAGESKSGPSITQSAFEAMSPKDRAIHFAAGGKLQG